MKKLSKRQFIRSGIVDMGAMANGLNPVEGLLQKMREMLKSDISASPGTGKFSRESPYAVDTPEGVRCHICPNNCLLAEGAESSCHTRKVSGGRLYSIAFGNLCAMHIDPIEKKPLFHFLPGSSSYSVATAGCNLTCKNCQNWEISQQSPKSTGQGDMYPEKLVDDAISKGCKSIAYTYSEPVAYYEYVFDTARYARMRGIKNLFISNGYINEQPLRDLSKYLDAANIDLKCFSEDTYARLSGGRLKPVLNALKVLKQEGVWLEITNLIIPGWTDDLTVIREMCTWLVVNGFHDTPLHFSRFHPAYKLSGLQSTPAETLASARIIALEAGMQYVYVGNMHNHVAEDTLCPSCGKVLIGRNGYQITENNLEGDACMFCHVRIAGVWA